MGLSPQVHLAIESQFKQYVSNKNHLGGPEKLFIWEYMRLNDTTSCDTTTLRMFINAKLAKDTLLTDERLEKLGKSLELVL